METYFGHFIELCLCGEICEWTLLRLYRIFFWCFSFFVSCKLLCLRRSAEQNVHNVEGSFCKKIGGSVSNITAIKVVAQRGT